METYKNICLMLPTYKRPEWLRRFLSSALDTASDIENLSFCLCINKSDKETIEFIKRYLNCLSEKVSKVFTIIEEQTVQPNLALYFNMMHDATKGKNKIISMLGDDMEFKTPDWDVKIIETINSADGKTIVYCNDDYIAHEKCAVNLFTTDIVVEATGKPFMCEKFHADVIDLIWTMTGQITGILKYLPDIIIKHHHSTAAAKEQWDETFKRLSPLQCMSNSNEGIKYAIVYSTLCAKNLIESGIGAWNNLI
jgi:hypothetical protein